MAISISATSTVNVEVISDNAGVRLQNLGGDARIDLKKSDIIRASGIKGIVDVKGHGHDIDLQNIEGAVTIEGAYDGVITFHRLAKALRFQRRAHRSQHRKRFPGQYLA